MTAQNDNLEILDRLRSNKRNLGIWRSVAGARPGEQRTAIQPGEVAPAQS